MTKFGYTSDWSSLLQKLKPTEFDVFHRQSYVSMFATPDESQCGAFTYESGADVIVLPFIKRSLGAITKDAELDEFYDITCPSGFGGPVGAVRDTELLLAFFAAFDQWCAEQNIVTSFFRLHPRLLASQQNQLPNTKSINKIVSVPLAAPLQEIQQGFKHRIRKSLRQAHEHGVLIRSFESIPISVFQKIYSETMDRNGASAEYYFDDEFLSRLNDIKDGHRTFVAYIEGQPISIEIALKSTRYWHSYLGGTLTAFLSTSANALLKSAIIAEAKADGAEEFILGGGKKIEDGIYQYKLGFAPQSSCDFQIQCNVHLRKVYQQLIARWESRSENKQEAAHLFQRYAVV